MKGDFTRIIFDPNEHITRVLMQQGRVQLDADWNEQASIWLHYLRSLAADLIGKHGGPPGTLGFKISHREDEEADDVPLDGDFYIWPGHYYLDGVLCENDGSVLYTKQPDYPYPPALTNADESYLVYLHAWERHVTHLQTNYPIREVALNGPDTATRAQLVCQVIALDSYEEEGEEIVVPDNPTQADAHDFCNTWLAYMQEQQANRGYLIASLLDENNEEDACVISSDSRYRGLENQLYRVEIHNGGEAADATFKFSRENGSVIFPLAQEVKKTKIFLEHLGKDDRFGLQKGDWVEIVDDDYVLYRKAGKLLKVDSVDPIERSVTLETAPENGVGDDMGKHPILRRWDQKAGKVEEGGLELNDSEGNGDNAAHVLKPANDSRLHHLEDGIQIEFPGPAQDEDPEPIFQTGDYWLIPARTATGKIEWPREDPGDEKSDPRALPPRGINHHFAPLAIITLSGGNLKADGITSCQLQFKEMVEPAL